MSDNLQAKLQALVERAEHANQIIMLGNLAELQTNLQFETAHDNNMLPERAQAAADRAPQNSATSLLNKAAVLNHEIAQGTTLNRETNHIVGGHRNSVFGEADTTAEDTNSKTPTQSK